MALVANCNEYHDGCIAQKFPAIWDSNVIVGEKSTERPTLFSHRLGVMKEEGPRLFQIALEQMGVPAGEVLVVDNDPRAIKIAEGLGMQTLHLVNPLLLRQGLIERGIAI